ncbi:MAG: Crp/Fnr family transcriptional regulator [Sphingomonadales bacterium]|nr:Crp/Fnr family transcriptional regulator [Sphingomonadales bacterium]
MAFGDIVNGLLTLRERMSWEASLARNAREYSKGVDLVREGDRPAALRIVLSGWAQKYKQLPDGRRQILAVVLPGQLCDLDLFTVARADHSIAAVRRLSIAEINRAEAQRLFDLCPNLAPALSLAEIVGASVQREWTINVGQRNALERVAQLMCEIYVRQHGVPLVGGGACDFLLTQGQMAEATGLTQVHVNRIVQQLRLRCAVQLQNLRLEIPDFAQLAALASFNANYLHLGEVQALAERASPLFSPEVVSRRDYAGGDRCP